MGLDDFILSVTHGHGQAVLASPFGLKILGDPELHFGRRVWCSSRGEHLLDKFPGWKESCTSEERSKEDDAILVRPRQGIVHILGHLSWSASKLHDPTF